MESVIVSAKVSVFYSKISRLSPSLPNGSTWHKHKKTQPKKRLNKLFITKQEQKARNKNKIGSPPNKRYRLTPLARHKKTRIDLSITIFGRQSISGSHNRFIR